MQPLTIVCGIFSSAASRQRRRVYENIGTEAEESVASPGVHSAGLKSDFPATALAVIAAPPQFVLNLFLSNSLRSIGRSHQDHTGLRQTQPKFRLRRDHLQAHLVEFRKVGGAAIGNRDTAIAAVVGLAHSGVDADFRGDTADQETVDLVLLEDVAEFGRVERALSRLVDDDFSRQRIKRRNDVVPLLRRGSRSVPWDRDLRCARLG